MSITELSEDKQLEAAMAASLQIKSSAEVTVIESSDSDTDEYVSGMLFRGTDRNYFSLVIFTSVYVNSFFYNYYRKKTLNL